MWKKLLEICRRGSWSNDTWIAHQWQSHSSALLRKRWQQSHAFGSPREKSEGYSWSWAQPVIGQKYDDHGLPLSHNQSQLKVTGHMSFFNGNQGAFYGPTAYHIISYHIISSHLTSHHTTPHHTMACTCWNLTCSVSFPLCFISTMKWTSNSPMYSLLCYATYYWSKEDRVNDHWLKPCNSHSQRTFPLAFWHGTRKVCKSYTLEVWNLRRPAGSLAHSEESLILSLLPLLGKLHVAIRSKSQKVRESQFSVLGFSHSSYISGWCWWHYGDRGHMALVLIPMTFMLSWGHLQKASWRESVEGDPDLGNGLTTANVLLLYPDNLAAGQTRTRPALQMAIPRDPELPLA